MSEDERAASLIRQLERAEAWRVEALGDMRAARQLLDAAEKQRLPEADIRHYRANYNACQHDYEHSVSDVQRLRTHIRYVEEHPVEPKASTNAERRTEK